MVVPHKAQEMWLDVLEGAERRMERETGSMMSWPVWMAARTERRESQLRDGARSRRVVGSLSSI